MMMKSMNNQRNEQDEARENKFIRVNDCLIWLFKCNSGNCRRCNVGVADYYLITALPIHIPNLILLLYKDRRQYEYGENTKKKYSSVSSALRYQQKIRNQKQQNCRSTNRAPNHTSS
jgi:hypothetical protein